MYPNPKYLFGMYLNLGCKDLGISYRTFVVRGIHGCCCWGNLSFAGLHHQSVVNRLSKIFEYRECVVKYSTLKYWLYEKREELKPFCFISVSVLVSKKKQKQKQSNGQSGWYGYVSVLFRSGFSQLLLCICAQKGFGFISVSVLLPKQKHIGNF